MICDRFKWIYEWVSIYVIRICDRLISNYSTILFSLGIGRYVYARRRSESQVVLQSEQETNRVSEAVWRIEYSQGWSRDYDMHRL